MEYLIALGLISMGTVYALIIVGCFKHHEW